MNKYVNVNVSATLSTDFYIEVPEEVNEETIKQLAEREVILPHNYPNVVNSYLKSMGIEVRGLDSMLKDWNVEEMDFIINGTN